MPAYIYHLTIRGPRINRSTEFHTLDGIASECAQYISELTGDKNVGRQAFPEIKEALQSRGVAAERAGGHSLYCERFEL